MSTTQERESELYKILEDLEETQYQCNRDDRERDCGGTGRR